MAHAHHGNARPLAITRYLQRALNDWLAANPGTLKKDLADRIGISGAHVTNITKNGRGVGADVEELCAKFLGMTVDELRRKAHEEFRDDRYVAALKLDQGQQAHVFYLVRAVSPGTFRVPPPQVEDMYRPELRAYSVAKLTGLFVGSLIVWRVTQSIAD